MLLLVIGRHLNEESEWGRKEEGRGRERSYGKGGVDKRGLARGQ